jgi:hypothetical protein
VEIGYFAEIPAADTRGRPADLCNLTNRKERGCPLSLFIYIPKGYLRNSLDNLPLVRSVSDNCIGSKANDRTNDTNGDKKN